MLEPHLLVINDKGNTLEILDGTKLTVMYNLNSKRSVNLDDDLRILDQRVNVVQEHLLQALNFFLG